MRNRKRLDGPKTAVDICAHAATLVGGNREASHGDKLLNFRIIAAFWEAYRFGKCLANPLNPEYTAEDAANMMEMLKIARRLHGDYNPDDYVDGAGYAGCAGEIADRTFKESKR